MGWTVGYGLVCYIIGRFWLALFKISLPNWIRLGVALLLGISTLCIELVFFAISHLPFDGRLLYGPWLLVFMWLGYTKLTTRALKDLVTTGQVYLLQQVQRFIGLSTLEKLLLLFLFFTLSLFFASQITAPFDSWDATVMWFYKAKHFYITSSIDESTLLNTSDHLDYPIAYPLTIVSFYMSGVGLDEQLALGTSSIFLIISVALLYGIGRRYLPVWISLSLPIIMLSIPAIWILQYGSAYLGYVDFEVGVGFLFFEVCFILWRDNVAPHYLALCLIALGLTASFKNEGVTFLIFGLLIIGFNLLLNYRRVKLYLKSKTVWIGAGFLLFTVGGWNLYTKLNNYVTDISSGFSLDRFLVEFPKRYSKIMAILRDYYSQDSKYLALLVIVLLSFSSVLFVRNQRTLTMGMLIIVMMGQVFMYLAVYVVTPAVLEWHIATTWQRLTAQLVPITLIIFSLALANVSQILPEYKQTLKMATEDNFTVPRV
jgi:hypothetical protein